jgi:hypothetical protein
MKTQVLLAAILCVFVGSITSGQEKPKTGTERESVDARFAAIAEKITRLEIHLNENAAATRKMASAINELSLQLAARDSLQKSLTELKKKSTELAKKANELDQANTSLDKDKPKAAESRANVPVRRSLPCNSESANSVKTSTRYIRASNCRVEPGIGLDAIEKIMRGVEKITVNRDTDDDNARDTNDELCVGSRLNESSRRLNDSSLPYRLSGSSYRLNGSYYRANESHQASSNPNVYDTSVSRHG